MAEGFTPGPWEVASEFVGPLQVRVSGVTLALVGHEDFATCAANAQVMAAAPELYERALRSDYMIASLVAAYLAIGGSQSADILRIAKEARELNRAALSKASPKEADNA